MEKKIHIPVLAEEVLGYLAPKAGEIYWDLTVGMGGHSELILKKSHPDGRVIAIDRDREALQLAQKNLEPYGERVQFFWGNFADLWDLYEKEDLPSPQGILLDLGASSLQLNSPSRGFSFMRHGPLDMRMDKSQTLTAAEIVNHFPPEKLEKILWEFGEERMSRQIVREIVKIRQNHPLKSTTELSDIISRVVRSKRIHPGTRTFQALRIAVNGELVALEKGLIESFSLLKKGGILVAISFHSLEDRIVKRTFREWASQGKGKILTKKPISASSLEIQINPRSRSAKLRAFEKGE